MHLHPRGLQPGGTHTPDPRLPVDPARLFGREGAGESQRFLDEDITFPNPYAAERNAGKIYSKLAESSLIHVFPERYLNCGEGGEKDNCYVLIFYV